MAEELPVPKHVAVILDGNRRWAKVRGKNPWDGHRQGAENIKNLLESAKEFGVKELTLYAFSLKNFNRDEDEVNFLFDIFREYFKRSWRKIEEYLR